VDSIVVNIELRKRVRYRADDKIEDSLQLSAGNLQPLEDFISFESLANPAQAVEKKGTAPKGWDSQAKRGECARWFGSIGDGIRDLMPCRIQNGLMSKSRKICMSSE
jgi:hypothetical protein